MSGNPDHGMEEWLEMDLVDRTGELVELQLLLPRWQAAALESAAHGRGVTTAQMMRSLVQEFCNKFARYRPAADARPLRCPADEAPELTLSREDRIF